MRLSHQDANHEMGSGYDTLAILRNTSVADKNQSLPADSKGNQFALYSRAANRNNFPCARFGKCGNTHHASQPTGNLWNAKVMCGGAIHKPNWGRGKMQELMLCMALFNSTNDVEQNHATLAQIGTQCSVMAHQLTPEECTVRRNRNQEQANENRNTQSWIWNCKPDHPDDF